MRVLLIDNYDSFTYNIVQCLQTRGCEVTVARNDAAGVGELLGAGFGRVIISPGPCGPDQAGMSLEVAARFPRAGIPVLGVCLGHQVIAQSYGGSIVRRPPAHGKAAVVEHDGGTLFHGLPNPLAVGRYHSLAVAEELPPCLEPIAHTADDERVLMALRHRTLPAYGVQFHPESILTPEGPELLANFLEVV